MKQNFSRAYMAVVPKIAMLGLLAGGMSMSNRAFAADLNGNITLSSDYVWRGSTQTSGNPAIQAGVKMANKTGLYALIWGSNVRFAPGSDAHSEIDYALGWGKALNETWTLDLNVQHYQYPSTRTDLDWTEINGTVVWKDRAWASVGYSNEALGYDANGVYAQVGAKLPINTQLRLEASAAHYFLNDHAVAENGYTHVALSAIWTIKSPVEARLTLHASDENAKSIFGRANAGNRVEAALQASF